MIRHASKNISTNTTHGPEDRKSLLTICIIATILVIFGYVVGQASRLTSYAQGSDGSSQSLTSQTTEVGSRDNPQQFSATNTARNSNKSVSTTLLSLGAITFATLGAIKVYKVMTE